MSKGFPTTKAVRAITEIAIADPSKSCCLCKASICITGIHIFWYTNGEWPLSKQTVELFRYNNHSDIADFLDALLQVFDEEKDLVAPSYEMPRPRRHSGGSELIIHIKSHSHAELEKLKPRIHGLFDYFART